MRFGWRLCSFTISTIFLLPTVTYSKRCASFLPQTLINHGTSIYSRQHFGIHSRTETFRVHADFQVVVELGATGTVFFSRNLFVRTQIELVAVWMFEDDDIVCWFVNWALDEVNLK